MKTPFSKNYPALKNKLLDPLKYSTDDWYCVKHFDHGEDAEVLVEKFPIRKDMLLIFDGIFLHRDELRGYWDFSVYLDVSFDETFRRLAGRDGFDSDPESQSNERYYLGQKLYIEKCCPQERASIIIDNFDFNQPRIVSQQK